MLIKIKELCEVDCINEKNENEGEDLQAERVTIYESDKKTLLEAFNDYEDNFNCDYIVNEHDFFDGGCLDILKVISVEEVDNNTI